MSVYVDMLVNWGNPNAPKCFLGKSSCHMYADTPDELHAMASQIGLKREWFQEHRLMPHYDLTESRRQRAVELGAIEHDRRQLAEFMKRGPSCSHDRLNEDGICRACGEDRRRA